MVVIRVRCYHRHFDGDVSSHVEQHTIPEHCLNWWKTNSGNGDFDLLSYHSL